MVRKVFTWALIIFIAALAFFVITFSFFLMFKQQVCSASLFGSNCYETYPAFLKNTFNIYLLRQK